MNQFQQHEPYRLLASNPTEDFFPTRTQSFYHIYIIIVESGMVGIYQLMRSHGSSSELDDGICEVLTIFSTSTGPSTFMLLSIVFLMLFVIVLIIMDWNVFRVPGLGNETC